MKFKAFLILSIAFGGLVSCSETKEDLTAVTGISLDKDSLTLTIGETYNLMAFVVPEHSEQTPNWSSTDENIATVSETGLVTALAAGETSITAQAGEYQAHCDVVVLPIEVQDIVLSQKNIEMLPGETFQLKAVVTPENASDNTITWSSSNMETATVSETGLVSAISAGETIITAQAGSHKANCHVIVKPTASIGDYYYSDGTWSSELNTTKTPVGIVFWVGNPTLQDPALKREHPDCTNGLVVALNEYRDIVWSNNYDTEVGKWIEDNTEYLSCVITKDSGTPQNGIIGYNNTKGLEAYNVQANKDDRIALIEKLTEHRINKPAPEQSSDWYMPSAKEVVLLFSGETDDIWSPGGSKNYDVINPKLLEAQGDPFIVTNYWSSSEYAPTVAVDISSGSGALSLVYKMYGERVRYILAF